MHANAEHHNLFGGGGRGPNILKTMVILAGVYLFTKRWNDRPPSAAGLSQYRHPRIWH
jgi:hypothetical protein